MNTKRKTFLAGVLVMILGLLGILFTYGVIPYADEILGSLFLYSVFAVFIFVYIKDDKKWWAIIPAGVLFSLATIVVLDVYHLVDHESEGVVILMGLSLTFFYLWQMRDERNKLDWAKYPAAILGAITVFLYLAYAEWPSVQIMLSLAFLITGLFFVVKALKHRA